MKGCEPWSCSFALNHCLKLYLYFHLIQDIKIKNIFFFFNEVEFKQNGFSVSVFLQVYLNKYACSFVVDNSCPTHY